MNLKYKILSKLKREFPEFQFELYKEEEYEDGMPYMEFGKLNEFIHKVFTNYGSEDSNITIYKYFKYINSLFDLSDKRIVNFIYVNTLEVLIGVQSGYEIGKKYMTSKMYNYFIEKFPYEQYKDSWDTSNYYTEEEYQRILDLPDVEDDESEVM